ncbi:hypothetical protein IscW_ISCW015087, partial [Ixodes scapularis]
RQNTNRTIAVTLSNSSRKLTSPEHLALAPAPSRTSEAACHRPEVRFLWPISEAETPRWSSPAWPPRPRCPGPWALPFASLPAASSSCPVAPWLPAPSSSPPSSASSVPSSCSFHLPASSSPAPD